MTQISARAQSRRQRERAQRLQKIRAAAQRVFAESGYAGSSMDRVAEEAELGKATLYYYFKTKEDLYADILTSQLGYFQTQLDQLQIAQMAPLEAAHQICRAWVELFVNKPDLARLVQPVMAGGQAQVLSQLGPELAAQLTKAHHPLIQILTDLSRQLPHGQALAPLILSLLIGLAAKLGQPQRPGHGAGPAASALDELDMFFALLGHRLMPPTES